MFISLLVGLSFASASATDPVLEALQAEVDRAMSSLSSQANPPYFIAVELIESQGVSIRGEDGGLHQGQPQRSRWVDVDVRVGSAALDSSHALRRGHNPGRGDASGRMMPLSDDPSLLQHELWLAIDSRYRESVERWAKVQAEMAVLVSEEAVADLDVEQPEHQVDPLRQLDYPHDAWTKTVIDSSALLAEHPRVFEASVALNAQVNNRWFVNSEGSAIRHSEGHYRAFVQLSGRDDDGTELGIFQSWSAHSADGLPSAAAFSEGVVAARERFETLLSAPVQPPYSGPAILSDMAVGVFFHEVFGHRIEGHRLKRASDAQTFKSFVGQPILPDFLSVYDDPTLERRDGHDLNGSYSFDNQGVRAQRVSLVEAGVLQGFLQSRTPVFSGGQSNGHGRRSAGRDPVSRQANLIVEASETISDAALRERLLKEVEAAGLAYGLYIDDIQGGFTYTDRQSPNAFKVKVTGARRIYVDGRPDEWVRGFDLIGTPLDAFGNIEAAGELHRVFNGSCGAESGWVPVSASGPSLLVSQVETQLKAQGQSSPPLLGPTDLKGAR